MVKGERIAEELGYRLGRYGSVLARHEQLLQELSILGVDEEPMFQKEPHDPVTEGPTIEQRRKAAESFIPAILAHTAPLNIHLKEPIPQPRFGNPLRWCLNNLAIVFPEEPVSLIQVTDQVHLAYDVIFGSWDVRSLMQGKRVPMRKRERIGGDNDFLSVWQEISHRGIYSLGEAGRELRMVAGFYRKGIQASIYGLSIIRYSDFLDDLERTGGYTRNLTDQHGNYNRLPSNALLTREEIGKMFEAISTIGEYRMARKPIEDVGLNKLSSGGRIDSDLVTDAWWVRS